MTLNRELYDQPLNKTCAFCGHELVRPGRWFAALRGSFTCDACLTSNPFGYEAKSRLFDRSAQKLLAQLDRDRDGATGCGAGHRPRIAAPGTRQQVLSSEFGVVPAALPNRD